jgi:hypothetical protein
MNPAPYEIDAGARAKKKPASHDARRIWPMRSVAVSATIVLNSIDTALRRASRFISGDKGARSATLLRLCFGSSKLLRHERSTVGEAYSLGRLNKARKSFSVPFKSCISWQYSKCNDLEK